MENNRANLAIAILCMGFALLYVANASDPSPLQDFCVAVEDHHSAVYVNGKFCKNPKDVGIDDFVFKGFNNRGDTNSNTQGAEATLVSADLFPALNTLGVAMARVDFGPFGLNTPHLHPRGSEIFGVLEGTLYAGFVTTDNKLFDTVLTKGDMIVFPQGLVHFQLNLGKDDAFAIASFGTQNPGRVNVADSVFGTTPRILDDVLTKAFQVDDGVIDKLRAQFASQNVSTNMGRSIIKLLAQAS